MKDAADKVVVWVDFTVSGQLIKTEITLPNRPVRPVQMVPLFNWFADVVVEQAEKIDGTEGKRISCKAGCGACCRQLVPLSETEAVHIAQILRGLPDDRRRVAQSRFEAGRTQLQQAGLLDRLRQSSCLDEQEIVPFGMEYFSQGIPCPFLENESCSIHEVRPTSCREYLVTSPAEYCATPTANTVRRVPLGVSVSQAVKSLEEKPTEQLLPWVPMILADEWVSHHTEAPEYPAPTVLQLFLERLKDQQIPASE